MIEPPAVSPVEVTQSGQLNGGMAFTDIGEVTVGNSGQISSGGMTFTNVTDAAITNTGQINGDVTFTGTNFGFLQNGTLGSTNITATSTGNNTVVVNSGRSVGAMSLTGQNNTIDNSGMLSGAVSVAATGENYAINRAGGQINAMTFAGPTNTIDNFGIFNGGLQFTASGQTDVIQNRPGGVINGISSTGNSVDRVHNQGQINGAVQLGDGNDWFVNLGTTTPGNVAGTIDLGGGSDIFFLEDGLITSEVNLGAGNDWAAILGGRLQSNFNAGSGNDTLNWAGGVITAGVNMGDGDDRAIFYDLTQANLQTGMQIAGASGSDSMTWQNTSGSDVYRFLGWE